MDVYVCIYIYMCVCVIVLFTQGASAGNGVMLWQVHQEPPASGPCPWERPDSRVQYPLAVALI